MERFTAGLEDPRPPRSWVERSTAEARSVGSSRLTRWPELEDQWYAFSEERQRGRARAWLVDQGYTAMPPGVPQT